jgi:hypothetical protein
MTNVVVGAAVLRLDRSRRWRWARSAWPPSAWWPAGVRRGRHRGLLRRRGQGNLMSTIILPGLAAVVLAGATVFELLNFDTLVRARPRSWWPCRGSSSRRW